MPNIYCSSREIFSCISIFNDSLLKLCKNRKKNSRKKETAGRKAFRFEHIDRRGKIKTKLLFPTWAVYFGMYTHGSSLIACYFYLSWAPFFRIAKKKIHKDGKTPPTNSAVRYAVEFHFAVSSRCSGFFSLLVNFGKINVWAMAWKSAKEKSTLGKSFRRRLSFARSSKVHAVCFYERRSDECSTLIRWIFVFYQVRCSSSSLQLTIDVMGFVASSRRTKLINEIPFRPTENALNSSCLGDAA